MLTSIDLISSFNIFSYSIFVQAFFLKPLIQDWLDIKFYQNLMCCSSDRFSICVFC